MKTISIEQLVRVSGGAFDPKKSDGCTLSPDGWWRSACVKHDGAYYSGGSAADRKAADRALRDDMIKNGAPPAVANVYYGAVRLGGALKSPWQWGFGKSDH
jgi:hypothetical protein